jgi:hypothetical protein
MDVGFRRIKWFSTKSAWKDMQDRRARRAEAIKRHLDMMDSINTAMSGAQQNKISGMSLNAAQSALTRIQALAKAKSSEITAKIDSAQALVDSTQATVSPTTGTSTMLDTVA